MNTDYIYWSFSTAAQSIAAFIAFILTGYALVHNYMESAKAEDETLVEIHAELQKIHYKRLRWLVCLTGLAIISSLFIVFFNQPQLKIPLWLLLIIGSIDILTIISGILFVISIVDPEKYRKTATNVLTNINPDHYTRKPSLDFFEAFLTLERTIRECLQKNDLYIQSQGSSRMIFSFRQMLETLRTYKIITDEFYEELMSINKYRNLVFHGNVSEVDVDIVNRVNNAINKFNKIISTKKPE